MAIPSAWLSPCNMKRIVVHWTAGSNTCSALDKEHYHIIVNGDGSLVRGDHTIADNLNTADGDYAAHTRGTNTGAIGISLAGMAGAVQSPFNAGKFPIRKGQWDAMIEAVAQLCRAYKIAPQPKLLLTHAEVQNTLGIKQAGKWDIAVLPFDMAFNTARKVGDRLRAEVAARI